LGQLQGEFGRGELDILSGAASRAQERQLEGLGRGVDFGGVLSQRELGIGELVGQLGGQQTIGGRQADLDVIASALAALDPDLTKGSNVDFRALAGAILGGLQGPNQDFAQVIRDALRLNPGQGGGGVGEQDPTPVTIVDGQVIGGEDTDINDALQTFLQVNPDLASGRFIVSDGRMFNSSGGTVAKWNSNTSTWERT
jgi:hypothetical protein